MKLSYFRANLGIRPSFEMRFRCMPTLIKSCKLAPFKEPCNSWRCFDICRHVTCAFLCNIHHPALAEIGVLGSSDFQVWKDLTCTHPARYAETVGKLQKKTWIHDTSHYSDAKKRHQNLSSDKQSTEKK